MYSVLPQANSSHMYYQDVKLLKRSRKTFRRRISQDCNKFEAKNNLSVYFQSNHVVLLDIGWYQK